MGREELRCNLISISEERRRMYAALIEKSQLPTAAPRFSTFLTASSTFSHRLCQFFVALTDGAFKSVSSSVVFAVTSEDEREEDTRNEKKFVVRRMILKVHTSEMT